MKRKLLYFFALAFLLCLLTVLSHSFLFYQTALGILSNLSPGVSVAGVRWSGLHKITIQQMEYGKEYPVRVVFEEVSIATNLQAFIFSPEKKIQVVVSKGRVSVGSDQDPVEGFRGEAFFINPFEFSFMIRDNNRFFLPNFSVDISELATFMIEGEFSPDSFLLKVDSLFKDAFFKRIPEPRHIEEILSPQEGFNHLLLKISGKGKYLDVHLKSKLIDFKLQRPRETIL